MAVYDSERMLLARDCANALGLKEISPILKEYGLKISDLPYESMYGDKDLQGIRKETSLLSIGVVYSYNGMLRFVDTIGHTYLMPNSPVVIEELKNCGYVICEYGKSSPDFIPKNEEDIWNLERMHFEKEMREKATLPKELAEKVVSLEHIGLEKHSDFAYDVFHSNYYNAPDHYQMLTEDKIIAKLGPGNKITRIFMSLVGYRLESLSLTTKGATTPELFVLHADKHPIINDQLYYMSGGLYDEITEMFRKQQEK